MNRSRGSVSGIKNKMKRAEVFAAEKVRKAKEKREQKEREAAEAAALGEAVPKRAVRTLDNTREWDDTVVDKTDPELLADEADDEFADIFSCERPPKIMMTTKVRPTGPVFEVLRELMGLFPNSFYYKRGPCTVDRSMPCSRARVTLVGNVSAIRAGSHELKKICKWADAKGFTHLVVVNEKKKQANGCAVCACCGALLLLT